MRRASAGLAVLLVVGTIGLWLRDRAAHQALAERVEVSASLGVWSSSTAPSGGQVSYFVTVRNDGPLRVWVTSVEGAEDGLRLRARDGIDEPVPGRDESRIPLSIRLTCARYGGAEDMDVEITVRRQDGVLVTRSVPLESAGTVLGVASSMCSVLPDVDDRELSGPVLARAGGGSGWARSVPRPGGGGGPTGVV